MAFQAGDRLGGYEVVGELGAGGMGKVYRVRNLISHREEAMKILLPNLTSDRDLAERFLREIQVQGRLQHPNIAALNTAFEFENQLVMVMELVDGVSLQERLKQGALSLNETVDYGCQVLRALSYAHKQGVVHRDIKPANMMLTPAGVVKLLDFGIAKAAADRKLTMTGSTVGSLHYMAPEQIQGKVPDPRSDLYSLGISLYQFATGLRPIDGHSDFDIMTAHLQAQPIPPIQQDPRIPESLSNIILMSLQKDPDKRFQSADAFLTAMESIGGGVPKAVPKATQTVAYAGGPAPATPVQKRGNQRAVYMAAGAVAALVVVGLAVVQVPKWLGTHASSQEVRTAPAAQQIGQPAGRPQPQKQPELPPAVAAPAAALGAGAQMPAPAERANPVLSPARPTSTPAASTTPPLPVPAAVTTPAAAPMPASAQSAATVQSAAAGSNPQDEEARKQAGQIREKMTLLGTRMSAVDQGLEHLQRSQAASGLGLRGDMVAAQRAMQSFYAQADSSLRAGDLAAAAKQLERAEANLEKLEGFLGR